MTGRIKGVSGPTVNVDMKGLKLYDRVYVGHSMLTGEVVRLDQDAAVIQVYENTKGLGNGEPVKSVNMPLTVRLGPGLLRGMFDGLQRPLETLREKMGPFISSGMEIYALDYLKKWRFFPLKKKGEQVTQGEIIGYVEEGPFRHFFFSNLEGRISQIMDGELSLNDTIAELEGGKEIFGCIF